MMPLSKPPFSVVIPTLQRSPDLRPLVERCAGHPMVHEVLVINNAPDPLHWASPKVRVLHQPENIYVNPAWNLGVHTATGRFLAILNDDILFDPELFTLVGRALQNPFVGIVGIGSKCYEPGAGRRLRLRPVGHRPFGFGTAMFLRRSRYTDVPAEMKIFGGDDWLFQAQRHLNFVITDFAVHTEMSVTSGSPEFHGVGGADLAYIRDHDINNGHYHQTWGRVQELKGRITRLARARS